MFPLLRPAVVGAIAGAAPLICAGFAGLAWWPLSRLLGLFIGPAEPYSAFDASWSAGAMSIFAVALSMPAAALSGIVGALIGIAAAMGLPRVCVCAAIGAATFGAVSVAAAVASVLPSPEAPYVWSITLLWHGAKWTPLLLILSVASGLALHRFVRGGR